MVGIKKGLISIHDLVSFSLCRWQGGSSLHVDVRIGRSRRAPLDILVLIGTGLLDHCVFLGVGVTVKGTINSLLVLRQVDFEEFELLTNR